MTRRFIDSADGFEQTHPVEFRFVEAEADKGIVEGYAAVFSQRAVDGRPAFAPGAFRTGLSELAAQGHRPAFLWAHDPGRVIGRIVEVAEDAKGLRFRGALNLATQEGRQALEHVKAGDVGGLSIGYAVRDAARVGDGAMQITEALVAEISLVGLPANLAAKLTSFRSIGDFERALRENLNLPRGAARKLARGGFPALAGTPAAAIDDDGAEAIAGLTNSIQTATRSIKTRKT